MILAPGKGSILNFNFGIWTFISVIAIFLLVSCSGSKDQKTEAPDKFTWAIANVVFTAPVWIAKEKGFFRDYNLAPEWKVYNSGHHACIALSKGEAQVANCTDFVAARGIVKDNSLRIIACTNRGMIEWLIARKDRGIHKLSDLEGKKIGLLVGSSSDFYLQLSLRLEQIPIESVEIVNLSPPEQIRALMQGEIDAIQVWDPFATECIQKLGENGVSFRIGEGMLSNWLLMSQKEFLDQNPSVVERIIKALLKAEEYLNANNSEAINIVQKYTQSGYTLENQGFMLTLDRPLLVAMETQARWLKETQPQEYPVVPNYLNFMYFSGLEKVIPERIRLSH
jgi:sulfonate transport system substrate-binding protein